MADNRTYFRRGIDWFHGDYRYLMDKVPEDVGEKHVNELLGRHPYHPFDPAMPAAHPCFEMNDVFGACMSSEALKELPLHLKHVNCFHPWKVDLMKCITSYNRQQKAASTAPSVEQQKS